MTSASDNLKSTIEKQVEKKLAEYEKNHPLSDEERATVRLILASILYSRRLKQIEKAYHLTHLSIYQRN